MSSVNNVPIITLGISLYRRLLYRGSAPYIFTVTIVDRYTENIVIPKIVIPGFCPIHFTLTIVDRYTGNIVIPKIVIPGFYPIHFSLIIVDRYTGNIVIPGISLYREYRYTEDRYTGVLPHTFYPNDC